MAEVTTLGLGKTMEKKLHSVGNANCKFDYITPALLRQSCSIFLYSLVRLRIILLFSFL